MKLKMVTQKRAEYFHNLRPVKLGLETAFGEIKMDSFLIIFSISIYLTKGGVFQYMGISIMNKQLLLQHLSFLSNLFYDCVCTCVSHSVHFGSQKFSPATLRVRELERGSWSQWQAPSHTEPCCNCPRPHNKLFSITDIICSYISIPCLNKQEMLLRIKEREIGFLNLSLRMPVKFYLTSVLSLLNS